jgi:hypothetical protein
MTGQDALSYIIPSFPHSTRFVRIEANFLNNGTTPSLERKIRRILMDYDSENRFHYIPGLNAKSGPESALAHYGLAADTHSCFALTSDTKVHGYLCRLRDQNPKQGEVRLEAIPAVAVSGRDTLKIRVINLNAPAIDVLYSIDGEEMPPISNWLLDEAFSASVFIDKSTRRGIYRFRGIRNARFGGAWIPVDGQVRVN